MRVEALERESEKMAADLQETQLQKAVLAEERAEIMQKHALELVELNRKIQMNEEELLRHKKEAQDCVSATHDCSWTSSLNFFDWPGQEQPGAVC